jgi:hypothetical protein
MLFKLAKLFAAIVLGAGFLFLTTSPAQTADKQDDSPNQAAANWLPWF